MSGSFIPSTTPSPVYKPYHDFVNYLLLLISLFPWIFIGKKVVTALHGDFSQLATYPVFILFSVYMLVVPVIIAMCNYNVGKWSRYFNWLFHLFPCGLTLVAFLAIISPATPAAGVKNGQPPANVAVVPVKKAVDLAVVRDLARELADSGVLVQGQLHVDWRHSQIPTVMNTLDNYRGALLERIIARDDRASGLEKEYFAAVSAVDDPFTAMHKQLALVCELEAAIACCHNLNEVDRLFGMYDIPFATSTITSGGEMDASLQTLHGFLTDKIQRLENGRIQVSPPDDYPRKPCALKDLQFIVIENPTL